METGSDSEERRTSENPQSSSSVIVGGAVAGVLPEAEAFAVHYPGYPSSSSRAVHTLGGLSELSKVRSSDSSYVELRFRPEDPYSHPAFGELRPSSSLLLKLSKPQNSGPESISASVVARVPRAYHFDGMVDYQHVVAVHAAEARNRKRPLNSDERSDFEKSGLLDSDAGDVIMMVPPLFSLKDAPEKIVLNPSANLFSKNMQRGVVVHRWEMDIEPCLAIDFNIENILFLRLFYFSKDIALQHPHNSFYCYVPTKINWEESIPEGTTEWEWQMAVSKLFDERPIWPRWSLNEHLHDDGLQVTGNHLKRLLFRTGYYFSTGPFGRFWIKKGYDPRKDSESRIYQRVDFRMPSSLRDAADTNMDGQSVQSCKDLYQFQVFPSKHFNSLQLFELEDDFIQEEIRKPTLQTACTRATGWFSGPMMKLLGLRVKIRFLSICPQNGAVDLLKPASELFDRIKKEEILGRIRRPVKELQSNVNQEIVTYSEPNVLEYENENQEEPINCDIEDEDEEGEEEEQDGYDSPPMPNEDDHFSLDANSYQVGEGISDDFLQDLLRGFPLSNCLKDQQAKNTNSGGSMKFRVCSEVIPIICHLGGGGGAGGGKSGGNGRGGGGKSNGGGGAGDGMMKAPGGSGA
ncbi:hypothetical protein J5N97_003461 [Dioscorea zingiberensis]|uniref:Uncharacterized protein n=1 Tax=Dioscorea zingiberensis TaxID=325984 RepID=A0A9D5D6Q1_9LILI|nr:hypothetical protein J5N97_003461 [Dioscorea zingiberensis]